MHISGITGTATIMGRNTEFEYDGTEKQLVVFDVTFDEAKKLVTALEDHGTVSRETRESLISLEEGGGSLNGAVANGVHKPKVALDQEKISALAASNPAKPPKEKTTRKKKAEPAPETREEMTAAVEEDIPFAEPMKTAPVEVEADDDAEEDAPVEAPKAVPDGLKNAKKLRDVLAFLVHGDAAPGFAPIPITDVNKLQLRCEQLKDAVPCLARIVDLDARVERTLEVMDLQDDVS